MWKLWVEGDYDKSFVICLLNSLKISNVDVRVIHGGISKLQSIEPEMRREYDSGHRIAVLFNANSNPDESKRQLNKMESRMTIPIEKKFLLPNDLSSGYLETLLLQMAANQHVQVYFCLNEYVYCLRKHDSNYHGLDPKAQVYAYCEALGIETGPDKNYLDASHWNLNAQCLVPLKNYLRSMGE